MLISVARFIVLKYHFRYDDRTAKPPLTLAVTFSWVIGGVYTLLIRLDLNLMSSFALPFLLISSLLERKMEVGSG